MDEGHEEKNELHGRLNLYNIQFSLKILIRGFF
jgi:hypothetical protein